MQSRLPQHGTGRYHPKTTFGHSLIDLSTAGSTGSWGHYHEGPNGVAHLICLYNNFLMQDKLYQDPTEPQSVVILWPHN